jgi:hypothetical protein
MSARAPGLKNPCHANAAQCRSGCEQGDTMPHIILVGTRTPSGRFTRVVESALARLGWLFGRVPHGVTPTLATSRWWR